MIHLRTSTTAAAAFISLLINGAALAQATSAPTESLYVIEQLTVSVNSTADGSGERVGQIKSGDRVEVLEHSGDQTRVKIPTGEEGWVRASYLSASRPLREQLKTSSEEVEKLRQERSKLEADLAAAKKAASAAASAAQAASGSAAGPAAVPIPSNGSTNVSAAAAAESSSGAAEPAAADPLPSNPPLFADTGILPSRPSWIFALVAAIAALAAGFALGWRMLDRRIRAKYGGLRIY